MTSSLVGSEMCIRDSSAPPRLAARVCGGKWLCYRVQRRRDSNTTFGTRSCLLYTSDAADDM
eukprot:4533802-Prorocentrum_lima.AAC.1